MFLNFSIILFLLLVMLHILLYGCKFSREIRERDYISLRQTNCIKGFSAIGVMLVHIAVCMYNSSFAEWFVSFGTLFVGVFFFYSGYGTMLQYKAKGELYLKDFPQKKLKKILLPWCVIAAIALVCHVFGAYNMVALDSPYPMGRLLEQLGEWVPNGWYIFVLLLCELVFYCFARLHPKKSSTLLVWYSAFMVIYVLIMGSLGMGSRWYFRSHCFLLGLIWQEYETTILSVVKKNFALWWGLLLVCTVFLLRWYFTSANSFWSTVIMLIAFVPLVQLTCMKVAFENPILDFLGNISMEIYLTHGLVLGILRSSAICISEDWLFALVSVMLTIDVSILLNRYVFSSRIFGRGAKVR